MTTTTPTLPDVTTWPTIYPRHRGAWTLRGRGRWGALDPGTGVTRIVDPADDADLPALQASLAAGELTGYRVGRRAVIATETSFLKVVRPKRLDALLSIHRWFGETLETADTPIVLRTDPRGVVELDTVAGSSLHELLRTTTPERALFAAIDDIAAAIAAIHSAPVPDHLPARAADTPDGWLDTIGRVDPDAARTFASTASSLPALPGGELVVTHGDLHDKNLFHHKGRVALIDLDSVALGTAEHDVANLAVHLHLRALQGGRPHTAGDRLATRLYETYQDHRALDASRCSCAAAHTWFRLACVYRFRSSSRHLVPELLRRAVDDR